MFITEHEQRIFHKSMSSHRTEKVLNWQPFQGVTLALFTHILCHIAAMWTLLYHTFLYSS